MEELLLEPPEGDEDSMQGAPGMAGGAALSRVRGLLGLPVRGLTPREGRRLELGRETGGASSLGYTRRRRCEDAGHHQTAAAP